jgi:hypothetical protein
MKRLITKPKGWWKNLSVSRKLYGVVGVMALLIATELFTLLFAMNTLSAVRALVGGEGLWSKAQKNALLEIQNYARTRDEQHYLAFSQHIAIPLGDHRARVELLKPKIDEDAVTRGFLAGQIHAADIPSVIQLLRRFHTNAYIQKAIVLWGRGDDLMTQIMDTAARMHEVIGQSDSAENRAQIHQLLAEIAHTNDALTEIEVQFSYTLGEASRWLEHLLMILLVSAVATVESTGLLLTIAFSRGLTHSLHDLENFAAMIGRGDFSRTLPVTSTDELGRLANSLNKMAVDLEEMTGDRQIAERANRIKSLFLANMSHEIRTPLNAILGFVDLLKDTSLTARERLQYLGIIERTGFNLATIINDILDISKVEAGKLEIEATTGSLTQLINDLRFLLGLRCEEKGIYLRFHHDGLPEHIATDLNRYKQILFNVIGNAIKFTKDGGVTVSFGIRDEILYCTVDDTGIGVLPENRDKLFRTFSQVDPSIRKEFGGTGLGLILSKRLAGMLGGDVRLEESLPGRGSRFVVTIAYKAGAPISRKPIRSSRTTRSLDGKRILLVEDSVDNQILAQQYLLREGAEVDIANHGVEALANMDRTSYDLVLMDMQMPIMDGYTATHQLRERGCRTPIIALTAHAMKEDLDKCLSAGCDSYLSKPIRRQDLISKIHEICSGASAA